MEYCMSPPVLPFDTLKECNNHINDLLKENNVEPKKTKLGFIWAQFVALIAQVVVFCIAFALTSNFFADKTKAIQIFSEKIGGNSLSELWMVGLGIFIVIGVFTGLAKALPSAQAYIDEFLLEIPRAIYAFGASSTAACICLAFYMRAHPAEKVGVDVVGVVKIAVALLAISFVYGCSISFVFNKNKLK